MLDRWSDEDAAKAVARWGSDAGEQVALRVYSSRLIGADQSLVLHGGGNTSVKDVVQDVLGRTRRALFVKGSGWGLADLEPAGLPAVDLHFLERMRDLETLSDEDMVNAQRTHMFNASSPNPSIETLLHAWIPHKFVDHSHADAIVAVTNTIDGVARVKRLLGSDLVIVPYVKPGFDLAKLALKALAAQPDAIGMVLMKHGLFTWGDTAQESYQRHIEVVTRADEALAQAQMKSPAPSIPTGRKVACRRAVMLAPMLRGCLAEGATPWKRWILAYRGDEEMLAYVDSDALQQRAADGPLTPDHVIRTKRLPMVVTVSMSEDVVSWRQSIEEAVAAYRDAYDAEFLACAAAGDGVHSYTKLDSTPRVILVPGVGLFGVGITPKDASIAADIAEHTLRTKERSAALAPWRGLSPQHLFEMEYWSLEQAKLAKRVERPLSRQVAVITGGAGAIGVGVAQSLLDAGCAVALLDIDPGGLERALTVLGGASPTLIGVRLDVTDVDSTTAAFDAVAARWGGVDICVVNAGIAAVSLIDRMSIDDFDRVLDVNLRGAFIAFAESARRLKKQGTGGNIVLISTKNVLAPGAHFGAYSASKAGAHQLAKVAAIELAEHHVRVNIVAPDAVFSQGEVPSGLWATVGPQRARSKGLRPDELQEHYRQRNLLKAEITGSHVGRAVLFFATEQTPTTGATLPVDGGVVSAFPR